MPRIRTNSLLTLALFAMASFLSAFPSAAATSPGGPAIVNDTIPSSDEHTRQGPLRVLFFSATVPPAHRHTEAIQAAINLAEQIAADRNWDVTYSEELDIWGELNNFDVVVLMNCGDNVIRRSRRDAFLNWVRAGGGVASFHYASFIPREWPEAAEGFMGAYMPKGTVNLGTPTVNLSVDNSHPTTEQLPDVWVVRDEFYPWDSDPSSRGYTVLASTDDITAEGAFPNQPVTWYKAGDGSDEIGLGRSWYTNLGHFANTFYGPEFIEMFTRAIEWAGGIDSPDDVVPPTPNQAPLFEEVRLIPGVMELENFDVGGEGVAYHDATPENAYEIEFSYLRYRETDVDVYEENDSRYISDIESGEWLEQTMTVEPGSYDVVLQGRNGSGGSVVRLRENNQLVGEIAVPAGSGWATTTIHDVELAGGSEDVIRIEFGGAGFSVDWIDFRPATSSGGQGSLGSVTITSPDETATLTSSDVTVVFEATGVAEGDHVHLTFDNASTHVTIPSLSGSHTFNNVSDGAHNVRAQLAKANHAVYTNPEAIAEVSVVVQSGEAPGEAPFESDLALHLEAAEGVVQTDGVVGEWLDISGNGNNLTASGTPQFTVTTPTGETAISFDGIDDKLERNGSLHAMPAGSANRSAFAVIKYDGGNASAGVSYGKGSPNQTFGLGIRNGGPEDGLMMVQAFSSPDLVSTTVGKGAGWMIQGAVVSANQVTHYKDGTMIDSAPRTYNTVTQKIAVGSEIANLGFIDMDVAAFLVYNRALTDSERMQVEAYLRNRYLVAQDEYANDPPTATGDKALVENGRSIGIPVLDNDADPDGTLNSARLAVVDQPHSGNLSIDHDTGVIKYSHTGGGTTDVFSYTVADDDGTVSNLASVEVSIVSGIVFRLESDQGINRNGTTISGWTDLSPSGNVLHAFGSPKETTTPSGRLAMQLDGVDDKFQQSESIVGMPAGSSDRTVFSVVKYDGGSAWAGFSYGTGAQNETFGLGVVTSGPLSGRLMVQGWGAEHDFISNAVGVDTGWMVQSAVVASDVVTHYQNGLDLGTATRDYETVVSKVVIGEEIANIGFIDMDIAAVFVFDRALTESERLLVETYLSDKYIAASTDPVATAVEAEVGMASADAGFEDIPEEFSLRGNYPNPFHSATTLEFDLPEDAEVRVEVYSLVGQQVLSSTDHRATAGPARTLELDAAGLASGVYVYRLSVDMASGTKTRTGKFVISR